MKKAGKYALGATLLVAFFLIPYEVHKHSAPEKSFAAVGDLPAPLSPHDSLIRMYADSIGWDWRLVAAVIRQEPEPWQKTDSDWSRFDYYEKQNAQLTTRPKAVLFGDSITRNWVRNDAAWLDAHDFVGFPIT